MKSPLLASRVLCIVVICCVVVDVVAATSPPLRITFSTNDLFNPNHYCGGSPSQQVVDPLTGVASTCDDSRDVLTAAKSSLLTDTILPYVASKLGSILSLASSTTMTTTMTTSSDRILPFGSLCDSFSVPFAHRISPGVQNTDVVIYVSALPGNKMANNFPVSVGNTCWHDNSTGRPTFAHINIPPRSITWNNNQKTPRANDRTAKRVMAGVLQALGFNYKELKRRMLLDVAAVPSGPMNLQIFFKGNKTLETAQKYFNCSQAGVLDKHVPLTNSSDNSSIGFFSRWAKDDVLAVVGDNFTNGGGTVLSRFALSAMADLGYYDVVDMMMTSSSSPPQEIFFGSNGTCSFLIEMCTATGGGAGSWFCTSAQQTATPATKHCSYDYTARGMCSTDVVPHGCSLVHSSSSMPSTDVCIEPDANLTVLDVVRGDAFGAMARCFVANTLVNGQIDPSPRATRCFTSRCNATTGKVEFRVGGSSTAGSSGTTPSEWVTCDADMQLVAVPGYSGTVQCPERAKFCTAYESWPARVVSSFDAAAVLSSSAAAAPTTTTTSSMIITSTTDVNSTGGGMMSTTTTQAPTSPPTPSPPTPPPTTTIAATPRPPLPTNMMTILLTFRVAFPSCSRDDADKHLIAIVNGNLTRLAESFRADMARLTLAPTYEVIVGEIRALSPVTITALVSVKRVSGMMQRLAQHTSTTTLLTGPWPEHFARVLAENYAAADCPISGLYQAAAQDLTPLEPDNSGCFINNDCAVTIGIMVAVVVAVVVLGALIWWRFCYLPEHMEELLVATTDAGMTGQESGSVFDDSRLSVIAHADAAAGNKPVFDPYMPNRQATSYADYFRRERKSRRGSTSGGGGGGEEMMADGANPLLQKKKGSSSSSSMGGRKSTRLVSFENNQNEGGGGGGGDLSLQSSRATMGLADSASFNPPPRGPPSAEAASSSSVSGVQPSSPRDLPHGLQTAPRRASVDKAMFNDQMRSSTSGSTIPYVSSQTDVHLSEATVDDL